MKNFIKKIITYKLKILTKYYLKAKKIEVVAITGSAGKTTTKVALSHFLKRDGVYVPEDGYNTEIGIPLAIFKEKTPDKVTNLFAWTGIIFRSFLKIFQAPTYNLIVVEMGADKPGDIQYLTSFIKPKISIVTAVYNVHTEEFKNIENIATEKGYIVEVLSKDGVAILNADNKYVRGMAGRTEAKVIMVGEDSSADAKWGNVSLKRTGIIFDLKFRGQIYRVKTKIIAPQLIQSLVSAFVAAHELDFDVKELLKSLEDFEPEKGRMRVIEGIKRATIIDDSYNANPDSVIAALEVLENLKGGRKVAVLGSMNELGDLAKTSHKNVGEKAAQVAELVITVGENANKYIAPEIRKKKKKVYTFDDSKSAGEFLKTIVEDEDIILFKGSQNKVLVEEAIKYVMKEPQRASELLVRQSKMWEDKKAKYFGEGE